MKRLFTGLRRLHRAFRGRVFAPLVIAPLARGFRPKRISAMMRVKNEEQFLRASVESILPLVEEVVLVDNASTDATPQIARELARRHPDKVRLFTYPYSVARVGAENQELAATAEGRRSPRLLANYYNWCLQRCRMNFVLKWDGDMVATPFFAEQIEVFRRSKHLIVQIIGANVHPDRCHLIGASAEQQRRILEGMGAPMTVENWTAPYTDAEMRLFPRLAAEYRNDFWWCESLHTPWARYGTLIQNSLGGRENFSIAGCSYLHLKYCKHNPYENFSNEFAGLIRSGIAVGPPLPPALAALAASL